MKYSLITLCISLVTANSAATGGPSGPVGTYNGPTGAPSDQYHCDVLNLANQNRANGRAPPLKGDVRLDKAAQVQCAQLQRLGYLDHNSPNFYGQPTSPGQRMSDAGYKWNACAENILLDPTAGGSTPQEAVRLWMNSAGHRANIMNPIYQSMGSYRCNVGTKWFWVQTFGSGDSKPSDSYSQCGVSPSTQQNYGKSNPVPSTSPSTQQNYGKSNPVPSTSPSSQGNYVPPNNPPSYNPAPSPVPTTSPSTARKPCVRKSYGYGKELRKKKFKRSLRKNKKVKKI